MPDATADPQSPGRCRTCGSSLEYWEPRTWESARHWFLYGGNWLRPCWRCTGCGSTMVEISLVKRRGWAIPWRVYAVLRDRRSTHPMPATYAWTAVLGSVVGAVLNLVLGWPWWAFTLGFVVLEWLVFTSSMFWGVHGTKPFRDDVRMALGTWRPPSPEERDT